MVKGGWNDREIRQCAHETGVALFCDEKTLANYSYDFGHLSNGHALAVGKPKNIVELQRVIGYANRKQRPITIRGGGNSQCGQSLPCDGGMVVDMQHFSKVLGIEGGTIWVEANTTWAQVVEASLKQSLSPYVLPGNLQLTIAGVLSAGGVGTSSFKFGYLGSYVAALEVMTADGRLSLVDKTSPLFQACLAGQGRFAVMTKICLLLRHCETMTRTFMFCYHASPQWFDDIKKVARQVDYMEPFCSSAVMGSKLENSQRHPFGYWLYGLHVTKEYGKTPPKPESILTSRDNIQLLHVQDEPIASYLARHDSRFQGMRKMGLWDMAHPWYECFVELTVLKQHLQEILSILPIMYSNFVQITPIFPKKDGFFMLPEGDDIVALAILPPGIHELLHEPCLQTIEALDELLLKNGGKRYLSGYLGRNLTDNYWQRHFGSRYQQWQQCKKYYDPNGILCSLLHSK